MVTTRSSLPHPVGPRAPGTGRKEGGRDLGRQRGGIMLRWNSERRGSIPIPDSAGWSGGCAVMQFWTGSSSTNVH